MLRMLRGKSPSLLAGLLLGALILAASSAGYAQDLMEFSQEFRNLVREIQRLYLHPRGWSLRAMEREAPATVAAIMGHALRQQALQLGEGYTQDGRYLKLEDEVFFYLSRVAGRAGYTDEHGNRITTDDLHDIAYHHLEGNRDADIEEFFGITTGQMPSVLGAPARDTDGRPEIAGDDQIRETPSEPDGIEFEDGSSLNLLGVTLDEPTSVPGEEDFEQKGPARKYKYDDIMGTWQCEYATLRVTKKDKKYVGICTAAPDPAEAEKVLGWRVGEKVFEVEFSYPGQGGPVYEGLGWRPYYRGYEPTREWGNVWPGVFVSENPAQDSLSVPNLIRLDTWMWRAGQ
jgi:hypothetical protein